MLPRWCVALVIVWGLFPIADPATAQVVGATASVFHDDGNIDAWLVRTFMRPQGTGLKPQASLDAYLMTFDSPLYNRGHMLAGFTPALGVAYVMDSSTIGARVGYTPVTEPNPRAGNVTMYVPLKKGMTAAADFTYTGTPRLDGLVQYFRGSSMTVTDGAAHVPVTRLGSYTLEVGGEGTWQSLDGEGLWAAGPSIRLAQGGFNFGLSGGVSKRDTDADRVTYLRLNVNYTSAIQF